MRSENELRLSCAGPKNIFRDDEACTFGRPRSSQSYDLAIFGDSHANHYTPTIGLLAKEAGISGRQISIGGCLALLDYYEIISPFATEASCRTLREAMLAFVEKNPKLQLVVLAQHWSLYAGKKVYQDKDRHYLLASKNDERSERRSLEVFQQSVERTLDYFEQRGISVLILGEVPPFSSDPPKCIAAAIRNGRDSQNCRRPVREVQELIGDMNNLLARLAARRKNVWFYSPIEAMCDKAWCSSVVDGVYMYRDRSHLDRVGAEYLARSIRLPHIAPRS